MAQLNSGIGNVTPNAGLVEMAMAYSRSSMLCAAARLGIADALGDEVRSVGFLAESCQADPDALYRLLRALASIGVTEETISKHFRLTPFGRPLRRDEPQSAWAAVIFWSDLLADSWSLLPNRRSLRVALSHSLPSSPWCKWLIPGRSWCEQGLPFMWRSWMRLSHGASTRPTAMRTARK